MGIIMYFLKNIIIALLACTIISVSTAAIVFTGNVVLGKTVLTAYADSDNIVGF